MPSETESLCMDKSVIKRPGIEHFGFKFRLEFYIRYNRPTHRQHSRSASKVGPLEVVAL